MPSFAGLRLCGGRSIAAPAGGDTRRSIDRCTSGVNRSGCVAGDCEADKAALRRRVAQLSTAD
jgi:hypothetical protein